MRVFRTADELVAAEGEVLGTSDWVVVDQAMIDLFAAATGDDQWIHVDPDRAADGPFGGTIAHGYLTLALLPRLSRQIWAVEGAAMAVNSGVNKVRFTRPVPAGSRLRLTSTVASTRRMSAGVLVVLKEQIELAGVDRPVCTAETLSVISFGGG